MPEQFAVGVALEPVTDEVLADAVAALGIGRLARSDDCLEFSDHRLRILAGDHAPVDPFDGYAYGLHPSDRGVRLFSSGPDAEGETEDDIVIEVELATDATP